MVDGEDKQNKSGKFSSSSSRTSATVQQDEYGDRSGGEQVELDEFMGSQNDPSEPPEGGHASGWEDAPEDADELSEGLQVEVHNAETGEYEYGKVEDVDGDSAVVSIDGESKQVDIDAVTAQERGTGVEWSEASPEDYAENVSEFIEDNPEMGAFLTEHPPGELEDHTLITSDDGSVGVAVSPDGDIQNLYNNDGPPGAGREAIEEAIEAGGRTLDCYDGYLPDLYGEYGFRETGRMDFEPDYAPDGWNFDEFGEPDVVFMAYQPEKSYEETDDYYEPSEWGDAKTKSYESVSEAEGTPAERQKLKREQE